MPHFSEHYRETGSGFGALAAGIGRVASPLHRRFFLPTEERIGREILKQDVPELVDVVSKKKSPKQALKNTVSNTIKKQTGGWARQLQQRPWKQIWNCSNKLTKSAKPHSFQNQELQKEVDQIFFQMWKMIANLLPTEATHRSFDLFEKPYLLVTFDESFVKN